jgi:hypothetical protein
MTCVSLPPYTPHDDQQGDHRPHWGLNLLISPKEDRSMIRTKLTRRQRILWQGRQWLVTTYGIEAKDCSYSIARHRLDDPYWLDHMTEKEWVDVDDFAAALHIARSGGTEALTR